MYNIYFSQKIYQQISWFFNIGNELGCSNLKNGSFYFLIESG